MIILQLIGYGALGVVLILVSNRLLPRADMLGPKQRRFIPFKSWRNWYSDAQLIWLWRVNMRMWRVFGVVMVVAATALMVATAFGVQLD